MQATSPLPTKNQTCLPSVDGDGEAVFPSSFFAARPPLPNGTRQISFPSVPMHMPTVAFVSSTEVRKILLPQTHGVELPSPGSLSFQRRFLLSPNSVGNPVSLETPSFFGPRHCGQFSADAGPANVTESRKA